MHLSLATLFSLLVVLILALSFFSASEIGMMSLNRYRLRNLVKKKHKQAIRVNNLLAHPDKLLCVILIGNTLATIVVSTVATLIGERLYGEIGVWVATVLLTLVLLIFAEMTPKTLAAIRPQQTAFASSLALSILQRLFAPVIFLSSSIVNGILRLLGVSIEQAHKDALSSEELRTVVHEAGVLLPIEHKSMLISLLDLEQASVEDIMVPKSEIVGIDLEQPWHKILELLETSQHTRLPLYRDNIDNLVGMIHLRSVLSLALEEKLDVDKLLKIANPPYFIPEGTPLNLQILNFQKMKRRSCFVVDEYGDLQGLVTMEDILEEVVGEFTTDIAALSQEIVSHDDGSFFIDASITIRNLNRLLNWQLPSLGPRTLSGLIIEYLGYIPPADCCLCIDSYQIEILKVGDNMIKNVHMIKAGKKKKKN